MDIEAKIDALTAKVDKLCEMIVRKARSEKYAGAELMDDYEVQMYLDVSKRTLVNWRKNKIITYTMIGEKLYYQKSDIEQLLKRNRVESDGKTRI